MRPKIVAGNWKMNKDLGESIELVNAIKARMSFPLHAIQVVLCPPFTSLSAVFPLLEGTSLKLGAQNVSHEDEGAFTGEISTRMLRSAGCSYVIVGHSERRRYFDETNELINKKAKKALADGLIPIICVGETLEEREKNITDQVVSVQVKGVLRDFPASDVTKSIIAYEPVWAIGTGRNATPEQADEVHSLIRKLIGQVYGWGVAEKVTIQYGGSVKPDNAAALLHMPNIDGALVGGASLDAESFVSVIRAATGEHSL
jgi:triosephosphate isomerase